MWKKVQDYMIKNQMLEPGERVIVALSGGADSVCLLAVLTELSRLLEGLSIELKAVHIHHGLRAEEADRDSVYAKHLCEQLKVPFELVYRDVASYAKAQGMSTEEAGRILRYEVLEEEADAWGASKIALAHHKDDNAETIFHHLLRGSGLKGLGGMKPVQNDRIRPLLCVGKEEICRYLTERGIQWCEDSTNGSTDYTRNRIRNQVLPLLKATVNEGAVEHILSAGEIIAQADLFLEQVALEVWEQGGTLAGNRATINLELLREQKPIIRTYLVRHMLFLVAAGQKDVTSRHYHQMEELLLHTAPGRCDLPGEFVAVRSYHDFWIGSVQETNCNQSDFRVDNLQFQVLSEVKGAEIPKNQYTKWFDYDKIKGTLSARTRKSGDYILLSDGGTKSVARYMIDEKIPVEQRDTITLLAENNHVLWIVGYRISEYYKITNDTNRILEVTVDGGENYGR